MIPDSGDWLAALDSDGLNCLQVSATERKKQDFSIVSKKSFTVERLNQRKSQLNDKS
jgi:hypothetical protein